MQNYTKKIDLNNSPALQYCMGFRKGIMKNESFKRANSDNEEKG